MQTDSRQENEVIEWLDQVGSVVTAHSFVFNFLFRCLAFVQMYSTVEKVAFGQ